MMVHFINRVADFLPVVVAVRPPLVASMLYGFRFHIFHCEVDEHGFGRLRFPRARVLAQLIKYGGFLRNAILAESLQFLNGLRCKGGHVLRLKAIHPALYL